MADFQLYYFNFWGRGEVPRLLLAASGRHWDDIRFSREEWPKLQKLAPFGRAPFLNYKGQYYGQSVAMANFLAREFGFAGSTSLETLRNDEVVQLVQDFMGILVIIYYENDDAKKTELVEKLLKTDAPKFCDILQRLLTENNNCGHFVGTSLSQADLAVYDVITNTQAWFKTDFEADYPALKTLREKVEGNENVKKYLDDNEAKQQTKE